MRICIFFLLLPFCLSAQLSDCPIPMDMSYVKTDQYYLKVVYFKAHTTEPKVAGEAIPYREVAVLGTHYTAELTSLNPFKVGREIIPAGTYSLFIYLDEQEPQLIINKQVAQWGTYQYLEEMDLCRIPLKQRSLRNFHPSFTLKIEQKAMLYEMDFRWAQESWSFIFEFL